MRFEALPLVAGLIAASALATTQGHAEQSPELDRVVARWYAPETGGVRKPQFVFERELAFEARLEMLGNRSPEGPSSERWIRAALDRHIAETMLSSLPVVPAPTPKEIADRAELARRTLEQKVHGADRLLAAAAAEGIGSDELDALFRRQAKASFYVDRMMAPMLEPTEAELRDAWRSRTTPFGNEPFEKVAGAIRRWYLAQRATKAVEAYYLTARPRVTLVLSRSK